MTDTHQKEREQELERFRDYTERMLDAIDDLFFVHDTEGNLQRWNNAFSEVTGYSDEEIASMKGIEFVPEEHRERAAATIERVFETGHARLDAPLLTKSGETILYEYAAARVEHPDGDPRLVGVGRDITERKEREMKLELVETLFEHAEECQFIVDVADSEYKLRHANAYYKRTVGLPPTEPVTGQTPTELFGETGGQEILDRYRECVETCESVTYTVEVPVPEHGTVFRTMLTPVVTDDEVTHIVGTARDITDYKSRERELQRYEALIETLPIGYVRTSFDDKFLNMNSTFVDMLDGDSAEEIRSHDVSEFYRDPATRERLMKTLRDKGEVASEEVKATTMSGDTIWVTITGRVVDAEDGPYIDALVQDITDRRRRESVLREMHDIISARDQSFDEKVQKLLELGRTELGTQYGTLSEIRGDDYVFKMVSSEDGSIQAGDVVPVSATNCEIAASTEQTLVLGDVERDAPEETDRTGFTEWGISCYIGAPVFVEDDVYGTFCFYDTEARAGNFSEWEVTLVDLVSRWVSYELQRMQANERLTEKNEQLEQFASIVSHDLRNPLNVAIGRLELAIEECSSEHLEYVSQAHDRMEALIDDLLKLALEGEQLDETQQVDLKAFSENCWQHVDTEDATLVTDAHRAVRADESRLRQLFENLIRNSVEHSDDGVTVTIGELEDGFYVEDDGRGIPEDEWGNVFEAGHSTSEDGTGFGLSIVKRVCDAHEWNIRLTEGTEGGARFEITGVDFVG